MVAFSRSREIPDYPAVSDTKKEFTLEEVETAFEYFRLNPLKDMSRSVNFHDDTDSLILTEIDDRIKCQRLYTLTLISYKDYLEFIKDMCINYFPIKCISPEVAVKAKNNLVMSCFVSAVKRHPKVEVLEWPLN